MSTSEYQKAWNIRNAEWRKEYQRAYYQAHKAEVLARSTAQRLANPEKAAERSRKHYRRKAGIIGATAERRYGPCEICGRECSLNLDHDHATGRIRGWLCPGCNTALGRLGDTVAGLERALAYLKKEAQ